jgi:hypothetical protein
MKKGEGTSVLTNGRSMKDLVEAVGKPEEYEGKRESGIEDIDGPSSIIPTFVVSPSVFDISAIELEMLDIMIRHRRYCSS